MYSLNDFIGAHELSIQLLFVWIENVNEDAKKWKREKAQKQKSKYLVSVWALLTFNQVNVCLYSTESGKQVRMWIRQNHKINECNEFGLEKNKQTKYINKQRYFRVCFFRCFEIDLCLFRHFIFYISKYTMRWCVRNFHCCKEKFCRQNEIDFGRLEFS